MGQRLADANAQGCEEVAAALLALGQRDQACALGAEGGPEGLVIDGAGVVDAAQGDEGADLEAAGKALGLGQQGRCSVVLLAKELQGNEQFGRDLVAPPFDVVAGRLRGIDVG